jgi:hypothetical protein
VRARPADADPLAQGCVQVLAVGAVVQGRVGRAEGNPKS